MHDEIAACDDFELLCGEPPLSVVPFRHVPEGVSDVDGHNLRLVAALQETGDVWVAPARVDGVVCLRPCVVNYRTTDDDVRALVTLARDAGRALATAAS
jgi:aromatic-L-amino-acid decarboxylase